MVIEKHYIEHRQKILKRLTFRAGTEWDAEDILHDAYERAIKYQGSFKEGMEFGAWFNTIVNNALKEHKSSQKGYSVSFDEEEEEGTPCAQYPEQVLREIYQLIKAKAPVQQEILNLHLKQDYSAIDISRITDYSYANCHQVIRRFREELKKRYAN